MIEKDKSGVGHCWIEDADIPFSIKEEIEAAILEDGLKEYDDYMANNGIHYRYRMKKS